MHLGDDVESTYGEAVYSPGAGKIVAISTSEASWGADANRKALSAIVIVMDKDGPLQSRFWILAHVSPVSGLGVGRAVAAGEEIGKATLKYGFGALLAAACDRVLAGGSAGVRIRSYLRLSLRMRRQDHTPDAGPGPLV